MRKVLLAALLLLAGCASQSGKLYHPQYTQAKFDHDIASCSRQVGADQGGGGTFAFGPLGFVVAMTAIMSVAQASDADQKRQAAIECMEARGYTFRPDE